MAEGKYPCTFPGCERVFDTLGQRGPHLKSHKGSKQPCSICGKPVKNLPLHLERKHPGEEEHIEIDLTSMEDKDRMIRKLFKEKHDLQDQVRNLQADLEAQVQETKRWRRLNMEKAKASKRKQ